MRTNSKGHSVVSTYHVSDLSTALGLPPQTTNLIINYGQHGHLGIVMVSGQLNLVCLLILFVILQGCLAAELDIAYSIILYYDI